MDIWVGRNRGCTSGTPYLVYGLGGPSIVLPVSCIFFVFKVWRICMCIEIPLGNIHGSWYPIRTVRGRHIFLSGGYNRRMRQYMQNTSSPVTRRGENTYKRRMVTGPGSADVLTSSEKLPYKLSDNRTLCSTNNPESRIGAGFWREFWVWDLQADLNKDFPQYNWNGEGYCFTCIRQPWAKEQS